MKIRRISKIVFLLLVGLLLLTAVDAFYLYQDIEETALIYSNEKHVIKIAREFFDSSRKLTSHARMYVTTRDPVAKEKFFHVLNEREGRIERDLDRELFPGQKRSILEMMHEYHVENYDEFDKFHKAYEGSSVLARMEVEAIHAVDGLFKDDLGEYTIRKEPDVSYAKSLMYSREYNDEKAQVMNMLKEFYAELETRKSEKIGTHVEDIEVNIKRLLYIQILKFVLLLSALFYLIFRVCEPIVKISEFAQRVIDGDRDSRLPVESGNEIGVLSKTLNYLLDVQDSMLDDLRHQSFNDPLTGFGNRLAFQSVCEKLKKSKEKGLSSSLGVIYADINCLKYVNDTYGHASGDDYIKGISNTILQYYRRSDVYRLGGDEFIFLCEDIKEDAFYFRLAEMLRYGHNEYPDAVAIGAAWSSDMGELEKLIEEADVEMYRNKERQKSGHGLEVLKEYLAKRYEGVLKEEDRKEQYGLYEPELPTA